MNTTEELRRLLDERGVEWTYGDGTVSYANGEHWCYAWSYNDDSMCVSMGYFTPEQVIAATLGRGTCKVEDSIIDTYEYNRWEYALSCGHTIIWESSEPPNYCPGCGAKVVE